MLHLRVFTNYTIEPAKRLHRSARSDLSPLQRKRYNRGLAPLDALILIAGGTFAGIFNTLAGGGSLVSVPLLVLVGLPGTVANGTNRVGIFAQSLSAATRFRSEGVAGRREALRLLFPIALGAAVGAAVVSNLADETFEWLFGIVMIALLPPILMRPKPASDGANWSPTTTFAVFLAIGLYGGAFQAGVGIFLVLALAHAGYDLVTANSIKVVVNTVLTAAALPVFIAQGQVVLIPALLLAVGFAIGGTLGASIAVRGGERIIRPALVLAVVALAGKMLGLY